MAILILILVVLSVSHGHTRGSQSSAIKYLETPFRKSATHQSSFFNRSIKLWNHICKLILPSDILNIKTFKNSITNLYKDELANVFDPDKPCSWVWHVIVGATCNNSLIGIS